MGILIDALRAQTNIDEVNDDSNVMIAGETINFIDDQLTRHLLRPKGTTPDKMNAESKARALMSYLELLSKQDDADDRAMVKREINKLYGLHETTKTAVENNS